VEPEAVEAREALLRDLEGRHVDIVDRCLEQRDWWIQQWSEGIQYLTCLLAQDVQEAVNELDPSWPVCPEHGDHKLYVEPDLGTDPFWVCERSGLQVNPVGRLLSP
jgi:hypothetical protein